MSMRLFSAIFLCLMLLPAPGWPQGPETGRPADFDQLEQDLDWIHWLLQNSNAEQAELDRFRKRVQSIQETAKEAAPKAEETAESLREQLEALAPPPGSDEQEMESSDVVDRRAELQEKLAQQEGYLRRIDLIETRGEELLTRIANLESRATARVILSRDRSLLEQEVWSAAAGQAVDVPRRIWKLGTSTVSRPDIGFHSAVALVVFALVLFLRLLLLRSVSPETDTGDGRYVSALMVLVANGVLPAAGLILAFLPLLAGDGLAAPQARLLEAVLAAGAAFLIARAWIHVALFPDGSPRLVKLDPDLVAVLARWLYALTGVTVLSFFIFQMGRAEIAETEFYRAVQFVLRVVIAVLFLHMYPVIRSAMRRTHETDEEASASVIQGMYGTLFFVARVVIPLVFAVNPVILAAGYWRLSDWLFFGVVGSCLLLLTLWLIRNASRELVSRYVSPATGGTSVEASRDGRVPGSAVVWAVGIVNAALWIGAVAGLFLMWGIPSSQIKTWVNMLLFTSVSVSYLNISLADIFVALGVFVLLVVLTRFVQRQLHTRILSWAPLGAGVGNALWSAIGYLGILAATVASLMALGINLSQLFIILGALSVGIGFGLQHIVHDFVSGLVLLFERPVRIGDWVSVDGKEGTVKRIGARASRIKTNMDGDVWLPNSRLTSSRVTNWTLTNETGRVRVVCSLHPDTDEHKARELMKRVAGEHQSVLSFPEPEVLLDKVDGNSIVLTLFAAVSSFGERTRVESDLRFSLRAGFREAGMQYAGEHADDTETSSIMEVVENSVAPARSSA